MSDYLGTLPDKKFFTMGEVCRFCQIKPYTLRYWEKRIGLPRPSRIPSGHRRYERKDLVSLLRLKELIIDQKVTLLGARKTVLKEFKKGGKISPSVSKISATPDPFYFKVLEEIRQELRAAVRELSS